MDDQLTGWSQPLTAVYYDDSGFPLSNYEPDFSTFTFTAPDGTKYTFNSDGTVASKIDRNGNSLTYSNGGITHSSGKQVTFTRDGNNRITEIYDPIAQDLGSVTPVLKYAYDGNGNLTNFARLIQQSPAVYENTSYAYTNSAYPHHVTAITDPRQIVTARYVYDSSGRLSTQYDAFNRATTYFYDVTGHRQVVTDRNLNTTVQTFTDAGKVATVRDGAGGQTSFQYDEQGRKIAQIDPTGATNTFSYDSNDLLTGTTNALGSTESATYNEFGEPLVKFDALNHGTTNVYDSAGNLINVTNALGIVASYSYDAQGNRTGETNALGLPEQVAIISQFDSFGYLTNVSTFDAQQNLLSQVAYTYDSNGNRLTESKTRTLPDNSKETILTQHVYDAANREIITIDPANHTNLVFFNGINKQSQTVDALRRTNSYFYDANGQLTNTVYADGLSEKTTYDAEGRAMTKTDRGGRVTQFTYDAVGRPLRTIFPDLSYTENTYDASGRLKTTTLNSAPQGFSPPPAGLTTTYLYDAAGRRTAVVDALNQTNTYAYDANGNQTNSVDALGRTNIYVFDALNRKTQIIYPDNTSESAAYDGLNRKIAVTNQAQVVAVYAFNALGRLIAVTNAFGTTQQMATTYVYDEVGNLRKQIDALNHTNLFEYDSLGQRTKEILPGNQTASFGYDAVGNLIRQTNFNLAVIANQYDSLNRLTNKSSVGNYNVSYAFSATGQRTNMVDASGTNSYVYDNRDHLLTKSTPQGTITYTYDLFGNLASIQSSTSNGTQLTYYYDMLNRLTNVVDRFANNTFYTYDGAGNLKSYRNQNNVTNVYSYNLLNRLTNISVTSVSGTIASFAYKLAPVGNRTNLAEYLNGTSRTSQWTYDPLYRLTNEVMSGASPTGTVSYKYDAVGNRTNRTSTVSGVTNQNFAYNADDQLSTDVYDSNGNTRTNGNNTFSYDVANRLISATVGGTNITIVYDGDGNRVKRIVGTSTNYFLVDDRNPSGFVQVLEELTSIGSTPARLYSYGLDLISQRQSDGTTSFYGYDGNGNVRFLTATNGTISDTYTYDAFGILIASTGTTPNQYRYTGEQYDPNLGFYFLRDRYMVPDTGRFLTRDSFNASIYDPPALHKYTYAQNDPVKNIDPSGKNIGVGTLLLIVFVIAVIAALIFHFSRAGKIVEASTIVNRPLSETEQGLISQALENLKRSGAFPNTQLDDINIQVADNYQHVGVAGSVTLLNSSTLTEALKESAAKPHDEIRKLTPMLTNFVEGLWESSSFTVVGISALGKTLSADVDDEAFADRGPHRQGFVVLPDGTRNDDLTWPLTKLLC